ncbi:MAG: hypothetical protein JSW47_01535 [Phycisphaerales bacterium]|nr:MAG: hypothetical protein JSW47_01535 [Phycisphaerales bacterium]
MSDYYEDDEEKWPEQPSREDEINPEALREYLRNHKGDIGGAGNTEQNHPEAWEEARKQSEEEETAGSEPDAEAVARYERGGGLPVDSPSTREAVERHEREMDMPAGRDIGSKETLEDQNRADADLREQEKQASKHAEDAEKKEKEAEEQKRSASQDKEEAEVRKRTSEQETQEHRDKESEWREKEETDKQASFEKASEADQEMRSATEAGAKTIKDGIESMVDSDDIGKKAEMMKDLAEMEEHELKAGVAAAEGIRDYAQSQWDGLQADAEAARAEATETNAVEAQSDIDAAQETMTKADQEIKEAQAEQARSKREAERARQQREALHGRSLRPATEDQEEQ